MNHPRKLDFISSSFFNAVVLGLNTGKASSAIFQPIRSLRPPQIYSMISRVNHASLCGSAPSGSGRRNLLALGLILVLGCLSTSLPAEDWPQFLGPRANGISGETGLLEKWPTNGPPQIWSKTVGAGYGAPSVRDNVLVLHHRQGPQEVVEAMEAGTGKSLWRHGYPSQFIDPYGYNNGPRCTPLLTEDRCYTFGAEGRLVCLDRKTGALVWERETAKDWNIPQAFFGVGSTPILEDGILIVMMGGQPNSGMVGLDARTGKTLWESVGEKTWNGQPMTGWPGEPIMRWNAGLKLASYSTPVAATIHGKRHVLCLMRQGLVSIDPKTGAENFHFWFRSRLNDSVNAMDPIVQDDSIFISAAYYKVGSVLLKVRPDGLGVDEVWRDTVLEIHWTTPILHQGHLFAFSGRNEPDARFRCVNLADGKLKWDRDERWPKHAFEQPPVYGRGSAILADGKLIVLGEGGKMGLFTLNTERPEEISTFQVPELHYPSWTAPVLSNKRLFLRSEDHLICFNLGK